MKSNGSTAVGDLCSRTRPIGGAERPSTSKLVRYQAPRAWSVQGIDGPIRAKVDVDVEPTTSHSSTITITVDFDGHGIGKLLVSLLVRRQASKEMPTNIERLKQQIEKR